MQELLTEDSLGATIAGDVWLPGQRRKWPMLPRPVPSPQGQDNENQQWTNPPRWTICGVGSGFCSSFFPPYPHPQ